MREDYKKKLNSSFSDYEEKRENLMERFILKKDKRSRRRNFSIMMRYQRK